MSACAAVSTSATEAAGAAAVSVDAASAAFVVSAAFVSVAGAAVVLIVLLDPQPVAMAIVAASAIAKSLFFMFFPPYIQDTCPYKTFSYDFHASHTMRILQDAL